jgi:hypothetical protein
MKDGVTRGRTGSMHFDKFQLPATEGADPQEVSPGHRPSSKCSVGAVAENGLPLYFMPVGRILRLCLFAAKNLSGLFRSHYLPAVFTKQ